MTLALSKTAERGAVSSGQYQIKLSTPRDASDVVVKLPVFEPRVRAGMDLLDQVAAGWQDAIDTDVLDLNSPTSCILGQTWPYFAQLKGLAEPARGLVLGPRGEPQILFQHTPFGLMVHHLAGTTTSLSDVFHLQWAAQHGFALSAEDEANADAAATALANQHPADIRVSLRNDMYADLLRSFFQTLTGTWIKMIKIGRATGRWTPRHVEIVETRRTGAWRRLSEPEPIPAEHARELLPV